MGCPIESYSVGALGRVSLPGQAAPSLFWAIPIGRWKKPDLESLWSHFMEGRGSCHTLGLLVAKKAKHSPNPSDDAFVEAGFLRDLIPGEIKIDCLDQNKPFGLLILSGAYPQPG